MQGAERVEHDQVTGLPIVGIDERRPGGVGGQLLQQIVAFSLGHADDVAGDPLAHVEDVAAGLRMPQDNRVLGLRNIRARDAERRGRKVLREFVFSGEWGEAAKW